MAADQRVSVVILFTHPLLGEGLAHMLAGEPGLDVVAVPMSDVAAAASALETGPDVVILERREAHQAVELLRFAPDALLIDVGIDSSPSFTYHREAIEPQPEGILREIQRMRDRGLGALVGVVILLLSVSSATSLISGS